jgi:type IV pilus assembly protein PilO
MTLQERLDELRSLDGNNLGSWPLWVRTSATVLVVVIIIALGCWFMVRPKLSTLHQHQAKEAHLKQEFKTKQRKVAHLAAYKKQLSGMKRSFAGLLQQLPSKKQEANLLNDISQARAASGLEEELFKPQPEKRKDFYAALPIDITVDGSYHEMAEFVSRVAALPRIVTIQDVDIQPMNDKSSPSGKLRMKLVAKTYRYVGDSDSGNGGEKK